jgi:alkylation response protein AidB-like acyl-CoA dehydrogenase
MLTLNDSDAEREFRGEIREWIASSFPTELGWRGDQKSLIEVDRVLASANLLAVGWPTGYGGRELTPSLDAILFEELSSIGVLRHLAPSHQGVNNLGPAIIAHGNEEQKEYHLGSILRVENIWCQGFSEPDAGSDLASVRTVARLIDGGFSLDGAKIWTSNARWANWIYVLARTGSTEERHRGLSFFLVPMESPGIDVRPIVDITGQADFCEVRLDDVRVPANALVAGVGDGWKVAMTVLAAERLSGRYRYGLISRELTALTTTLSSHMSVDDDRWIKVVTDIGRMAADIQGIYGISMRVDSMRQAEKDTAKLSSVNKLWWPAVHQRLAELGLRLLPEVGAEPDEFYRIWLESRAESIYGGSAQIQRNLIAERHLGMPKN